MIFFVGNDGTIVKGLPSPVYQGAANSNTVYLIAPFAENTAVTVAFKLPNGVVTAPAAMAQQGAIAGVTDAATGQTYAGWTYDLPNSITSLYGTVTAQFFFYSAQAGVITATSGTSFQVGRGVPAVLPDTPEEDVYEQILSNIAALQTDVSNGYYAARAIYAWNSAMTYGANEITYYPVGTYGALVKSLVANNTNNEPYTTGGVPNSAFWEEVLNFDGALSEAQGYAASAATSEVNAALSAQSAADDAAAAQTSADAAETSQEQAAGAATAAENSATAAAGSATAAANSATEAQGYAQQAKDYAQKHYAVYPSFDALPVPGDAAFIYLVPTEEGEENNNYTEYLWITETSSYESIGTVNDIDLSGYAQINGTYAGMTVGNATNAQTAQNAQQLGGVAANQYARTNGTYSGMTVGKATNADNATKATQDASGNVITVTYATKTENNAKYTKPSTGIPESDLASAVQTSLGKADTAYQKPSGGIPKTDLASAVQTSLGKADTALQSVPLATSSTVGGVKPTAKTSEMTQAVGVDSNGALWTAPGGGGITKDYGYFVDLGNVTFNTLRTLTDDELNAINDDACLGITCTTTYALVFTKLNLLKFMAHDDSTQYVTFVGGIDIASKGFVLATSAGELLTSVPLATSSALGGVKPVAKTDDMTQSVGVDANGALFTAPSGGDIEYMTDDEVDALFASTPSIPSFADATWEQIAQVAEAGTASDYFAVGDEKTIALSTDEQITLVILGFNHDDLSDGSGKAGITIGMKNLLATTYRMNATVTNAGGWDESEMRTSTMATLLSQLPSDLQSVIKQVNKKATAGGASTSITTSSDKLWLLAVSEIFSATSIENSTSSSIKDYADAYNAEGTQYKYYENLIGDNNGGTGANSLLIKKLSNGSGSAKYWWLRSPDVDDGYSFRCIQSLGNVSSDGATLIYGVSFNFCV